MHPSILRWARVAGMGLLIWLTIVVLSAARPIHAGGGCAVPYTVQRGDTLTSIALRFGVSYDELVRANQGLIRNPNLIFAGQELCLPQQQAEPSQQQAEPPRQSAAPSQPPGEFKVVLEARYMVKMMPEESPLLKIAGSGVLGKRVEYPLQSINGLETYSDTVHLMPALAAKPSPVLVGIRNSPSGAEDYTLVVIDRDDVLTSLMISDTLTITPSTSGATRRVVSETLKSGYVERASLVLWFETEEGVRRPFIVTKLDFVPDYQHFVQYYTGPGGPETGCRDECIDFALFPASDGRYRMVIRLSNVLNGPVQAGDVARCRSWMGKAGLWHWFLRIVNRCARW